MMLIVRDVLELDRVRAVGRRTRRSGRRSSSACPRRWRRREAATCRRCARSKLNTTSSAVNGVPSWNLTPGRSLKRHVVGLTCVHDSASDGTSFSCLSRIDQELVDEAVDVVGEVLVLRVRVGGLHVAAAGPAQRLGVGVERAARRERGGERSGERRRREGSGHGVSSRYAVEAIAGAPADGAITAWRAMIRSRAAAR